MNFHQPVDSLLFFHSPNELNTQKCQLCTLNNTVVPKALLLPCEGGVPKWILAVPDVQNRGTPQISESCGTILTLS